MRTIRLTFCEVDIGGERVNTRFIDGTAYGAFPHHTPEYRAVAERCGYADVMAYCAEHEVAHHLIGQELYGSPSRVIWALAHGTVAPMLDILHEESLALDLQAFARANVLPGSSAPGFSWFRLRAAFRAALA